METAIWLRAGLTALANPFRRKNKTQDGGLGPGSILRIDFSGVPRVAAAGDPPSSAPTRSIYVGGDPVNAGRLAAFFPAAGRIIVPDPAQADEIILCEGAEFTFYQIIEAIQDGPGRAIYKIHAAASSSAVGSRSKDGRGEILFFPPKA
jgi:hypothetical protein